MICGARARLEIHHKLLKTDPLAIFQTNQSCAHSLALNFFFGPPPTTTAHLFALLQTAAEFISWYLHQSIPYGVPSCLYPS